MLFKKILIICLTFILISQISFGLGTNQLQPVEKLDGAEVDYEVEEKGVPEPIPLPKKVTINPNLLPIWHGDEKRKTIALTFDDGPKPDFCPAVLDILDQFGVRTTFFVVGREARWQPDLIYRMASSGHEIGNHSYSHPRMDGLTKEEISTEIEATNRIVYQITGQYPFYFRPPGGRYNQLVLEEVTSRGQKTVNWTINTGDYTALSSDYELEKDYEALSQKIVDMVLAKTKNGSIILFHNGGKETVMALPKVIQQLKSKGFEFVTLSNLLSSQSSARLSGQVVNQKNLPSNDP